MERKRPVIDEQEPWMISYADLVTLLLAFFVVLAAVASISKTKLEMVSSFFESASTKEGKISIYDLSKKAQELVIKYNLQEDVKVTLTDRGVEINVMEKLMFASGKSILNEVAHPILTSISNILSNPAVKDRKVVIEGHTDSVPIHTSLFPSNWELSTARACEVVRFFTEKNNIESKRFEAKGYADTHPAVPEEKGKGQPANRRVTMLIY